MIPEYSPSQIKDKIHAVARLLFSDWLSTHADDLIIWNRIDVVSDVSFQGVDVTIQGEVVELVGLRVSPFKITSRVQDIQLIQSLYKNFEDFQSCQ